MGLLKYVYIVPCFPNITDAYDNMYNFSGIFMCIIFVYERKNMQVCDKSVGMRGGWGRYIMVCVAGTAFYPIPMFVCLFTF